MDPSSKFLSKTLLFLIFESLIQNASAEIIYQDIPLVPKYMKAHGIVMGLAFVVIFPLGAFAIRGIRSRTGMWIHIICQLVGSVLMITGLAMGIRTAKIIDLLYNNPHTKIGTVIVVMMLLQPLLGYIHHRRFVATQKRTIWTQIHVWVGRGLILLGIINGGIGLQMANNAMHGSIAYSVLGGIFGAAVLLNAAVFETKDIRRRITSGKVEQRSKPVTA